MPVHADLQGANHVDCVIAGAGVIGLAIARELAMRRREVLVIERNSDFGLETSGRNSEVIHAGIYYQPGSLKARLCREGHDLLVAYLRDRKVEHRICGKLIVAASAAQQDKLDEILLRARSNGVNTLERISRPEVLALEPELNCESGLLSPASGILDSRGYMQALLSDIEAGGGALALQTETVSVRLSSKGHRVETEDATGERFALTCNVFVNAAGLHATRLAQRTETATAWVPPVTRFARGNYYSASGAAPFSRLVYPVPEPGGLGVHLTLDLQGTMRFGPDVEWLEEIDYRLSDHRRKHFRTAIARYWPGIEDRELNPVSCGIRPKLSGPGEADADFLIAGPEIHGTPGLVQLFGMESPGLTSSLAIAAHVAELV
jgi:L-2-hydroxyglutarate oxidase LhgO